MLEVLRDRVFASLGRGLLMTSTRTKHNGASIISLYFFRENGRQYIFGLELPRFVSELFLFCILSQSFDSEVSEMNFDRASVLSALRAICNISRDDGEDFFADDSACILGIER